MKTFQEFLVESKLSYSQREELKDSDFGLPKERKFPLIDAAHVRNALARFHFAKESSRAELAKNIRKMAKKFDVEISEDDLINDY